MFWHKIDVDNLNIFLEDNNPYYIEICHNTKIMVNVKENICTKLVIIANNDYEINIMINNNSKLTVNSLNKDNNSNVFINLNNNSSIDYYHSTLSLANSENIFNINHLTNDSTSNLYNSGINNGNGKLYYQINGVISNKLHNIICHQNSQIINYQMGDSKIIPNLIIDSNDIIASHAAYIGKIGDEEKFYMQSRGINEDEIKKVIYKAILIGKMDLSKEKDEFNKRINEWW